jgi:hypothetical protein
MSNKHPTEKLEEIEEVISEDYEIGDQDYGFVIGADGELKHLFTPTDFYLEPPPIVRKILKLLGIKDINAVAFDGNDTVH